MRNATSKVALVTGGAKRIGRAICLKLAQLGYDIALHYNASSKEARELAQLIRQNTQHCEIFRCDLANESQISQLIKKVYAKYKRLDVLINSASLFEKSNFKNETNALFNKHFNVNFKAPFILTRDFARLATKGQIINILDANVVKNKTSHLSYLLSKKSLYELTKVAAVELAPHIRVNGIAPGFILPPKGATENYLNRLRNKIPLQTQGSPEQIAFCVEFLLKNPYVTGQVIFNDGGEHL